MGFPFPSWGEVWGGGYAPSPENFLTSEWKMTRFGAFWVALLTDEG